MNDNLQIERHPFAPFCPEGAKVLLMGTFPPQPHRWAMEFYYPNRTNDFWKVMGIIFYDDPKRFFTPDGKGFREADIKAFLTEKHIALHDTGAAVRRLRDNASDKYLEIVEKVDLGRLLAMMPDCRFIGTTGEKAAGVIAELTGTPVPRIGEFVVSTEDANPYRRELHITRLPSTSRAYPLSPVLKAEAYRRFLEEAGIVG